MASYQWGLNWLMDGVWGQSARMLETLSVQNNLPGGTFAFLAPLLVPALMLGLSGTLGELVPNGSAGLFVSSVLNSEPVSFRRGAFGVTLISLIAIASGGSAGPEGPVLGIGSAIGTYYWNFQRRLSRRSHPTILRRSLEVGDMVLVAGCASIAAFFDDPLSGCIFVLEVPHISGLQRSSAFPAALVACVFSHSIHRAFMGPLGVAYSPSFRPSSCNEASFFLVAVIAVRIRTNTCCATL
jgi:H+/Cl- antiporter ClcA